MGIFHRQQNCKKTSGPPAGRPRNCCVLWCSVVFCGAAQYLDGLILVDLQLWSLDKERTPTDGSVVRALRLFVSTLIITFSSSALRLVT